jgi:hypothetical protein
MKREIVLYWKPGPLFLDYDHIKLSAEAANRSVSEQIDLVCDKLEYIQDYYSAESAQ